MDIHVVSSVGTHYIIEMQVKRHLMFDERALYYACSIYSRQLSDSQLGNEDWYTNLKPVIALQILDYDTNRVRGLKSSIGVVDTLPLRVKENPLSPNQFIKNYRFVDEESGQVIDYMQLIQVELPRAELHKKLFPPEKSFTVIEWWLSILRHTDEYTDKIIDSFKTENLMPDFIYEALRRLDLKTWKPELVVEYNLEKFNRSIYKDVLSVERNEGRIEGLAEAKKEIIVKMIIKNKTNEEILGFVKLMKKLWRKLGMS